LWNCGPECATFAPRSTVEKWIGARSASKGCRGWWRALFGNLKKLLALGPEGVEECSGGRSPAVEVAPLFREPRSGDGKRPPRLDPAPRRGCLYAGMVCNDGLTPVATILSRSAAGLIEASYNAIDRYPDNL